MWSDAARQAALAARRAHARTSLYTPGKHADYSTHVTRNEMARVLREYRSADRLRGFSAVDRATKLRSWGSSAQQSTKIFTNVKGSHFVDQGLRGVAWRQPGQRAAPSWAASQTRYYTRKR